MKRHFQWLLLTLVLVMLAGVALFPTAEASRGGGVASQKASGPQEKRETRKAAKKKAVDNSAPEPANDRAIILVAGPAVEVSKSAAAPQGGCSSITCPANITQSNDPGQCGATVTYPAPTPNGSCGTINCSPASNSFFPVGTTTVNCTSSAGPTCSFTVTVNDTEAPTLACPEDIAVPVTPGFEGANVEFQTPTASDNCAPAPTVNCSPASGSFFAVGITQVTCVAGSFSCVNKTITHSSSQTITPGNSGRCEDSGGQFDNHYWRAFSLPAFSINGTFHVQSVDIGIEQASSGSSSGTVRATAKSRQKDVGPNGVGGQQITVLLHNNTGGAFPGGTLNFLNSVTLNISDQSGTILNVPVNADLPSGSELVVEVFSADGHAIGTSFLIGSNAAAETGPSYISAPDCGIPDPVTTSAFGFPNMHIVMNVNGCEDIANPGSASCNFNVTVKPPRYWSTIGSGGTADEDSIANLRYDDFGVRLKDGVTGTATIRYNITANYGISAFCPATQSVVYTRFRNSDDSGGHARVKFEVHRTNILSGGNDVIYTFSSDGVGAGNTFTSVSQSPTIDFDFSNYIYWIEATLFRDQAGQFADLGSIEIFESEGTPCPSGSPSPPSKALPGRP
jgi:HYR domain